MSKSLPCLLLTMVVMALLQAAAAANPASQRRYGELLFEPCSLTASGVPSAVEAQCGKLSVAENRADPNSRRIDLALAWIPASGEAAADPVFMIAGGPGQSALQSYPMVDAAFRDVQRTRHVLLLDARGTGGSNALMCRDAEGRPAISEGEDDSLANAKAFAERCRDQLATHADLRYYGTGEHVEDLDAVRQALGVAQINLLGISYGTRVAQHYARRYPQHTRAVVLDSVVPNELVLGSEHAKNLDAALEQHFQRCRELPACQQLGDPRAHLASLRDQLREGRLAPVRFRDPTSGAWHETAPNFGHLALLLRLYAYAPQTATLLPWILHEASQGDYAPLLAQSRMVEGQVTGTIYHGMQLSVMCSEEDAELAAAADDANTVLGNDFVEFAKAQCAVWPKGERAADFRAPLSGPLPLLALSGQDDPVTPPRYAEAAIAQLPNARHLELKGQGHNVIGVGCMPKLFAQFLESADAKQLDASCLDRLRPLPPFAGTHGWEP